MVILFWKCWPCLLELSIELEFIITFASIFVAAWNGKYVAVLMLYDSEYFPFLFQFYQSQQIGLTAETLYQKGPLEKLVGTIAPRH